MALLDIAVSIFDIVFLAGLLIIIRFYIEPGTAGSLSFLPAWIQKHNNSWIISIFLLLFCIKNGCAYLSTRSAYSFINSVATRISAESLVHYQQSAFSGFVQTDSSVYLRRICYQPFEFAQYMLAGLQQLITQLALILFTIAGIMLFNAGIFLLLLALLLPPAALVFRAVKNKHAAVKKSIQLHNELSFKYVLDALKGYVESNIYNRNHFFLNRFVSVRSKFSRSLFESMALQSLPGRIIEVVAVLGLFILVMVANWWNNGNNNMLLTIGAFMVAAYKLIPGIVKLINITGQMKAYEFSLTQPSSGREETALIKMCDQIKPLQSVKLNNICFEYAGLPVLTDLSIAVGPGDFIGITGKSGKGKTTILNILLGFLQPTSGDIYFNDELVTTDVIRQYWPSVAYLRQQSFLINDTIIRNICLEESVQNKVRLEEAMRLSGVDVMVQAWPDGMESIITENGKNISGGQQQRIGIARALYKDARIILLDEPFNELDAAAADTLLSHFKALAAAGKAVVMITHDQNSLNYCNKIISLDA